ncbi:hypothetical protein BrevBR_16230 [Brevundimonas sp. BR2-1]|uniref:hypothetical protein n=1 Tax=Brevundimonas sp. BR2-1 TaxID=3031123 RepID=UPI0030ADFB81
MSDQRKTSPVDDTPGLVVGGQGGSRKELLEDGQEEVFSRTEVETGRIEHKAEAGSGQAAPAPFGRPHA